MKQFIHACKHGITTALHRATAMLLPTTCVGCDVILPPQEPLGLCPTCWHAMPRWHTSKVPSPRLPLHLDGFAAPFLYEGLVRDLILQFKFADKTELAPVLTPFMALHLPKNAKNCLFIPVPLHNSRLRRRLYNQSALLARLLAKKCHAKCNVNTVLTKIVATKAQAQKSATARKNLSHSTFAANPAHIKGKDIILIDDIFTTGSTLNACAAQLKKNGAHSVFALTLAYTQP